MRCIKTDCFDTLWSWLTIFGALLCSLHGPKILQNAGCNQHNYDQSSPAIGHIRNGLNVEGHTLAIRYGTVFFQQGTEINGPGRQWHKNTDRCRCGIHQKRQLFAGNPEAISQVLHRGRNCQRVQVVVYENSQTEKRGCQHCPAPCFDASGKKFTKAQDAAAALQYVDQPAHHSANQNDPGDGLVLHNAHGNIAKAGDEGGRLKQQKPGNNTRKKRLQWFFGFNCCEYNQ